MTCCSLWAQAEGMTRGVHHWTCSGGTSRHLVLLGKCDNFVKITYSRASKKPSSASNVQVSSSWILCQHFSVFLSQTYRGDLFRKIRERGENTLNKISCQCGAREIRTGLFTISTEVHFSWVCTNTWEMKVLVFFWEWVVGINIGTEHTAEKILQYHERS